jgi:hypothetical protein
MSLLEVAGIFTMLVPDDKGWQVTGADRAFELTRPGDDGALHISVYERDGSALSDEAAAGLLDRFISTIGPELNTIPVVMKESSHQHRAVARFTASDQGASYSWLAFLILWRKRFLICSCAAGLDSRLPDEAEQMFASIIQPKRGLFRKR